jgi:hypothetical protein
MSLSENKIKSLEVSATRLRVALLDGRVIAVPLTLFPTLAEAKAKDRHKWELRGAGTGIHWPLLDYDLSVAGLLRREPEAPGLRCRASTTCPVPKTGKASVLSETPPNTPPRKPKGNSAKRH